MRVYHHTWHCTFLLCILIFILFLFFFGWWLLSFSYWRWELTQMILTETKGLGLSFCVIKSSWWMVEKAVGMQHSRWICRITCLDRQAGENEKAVALWPISAVNTSSLNVWSSIILCSEWYPGWTNTKAGITSFLLSWWGTRWHKMSLSCLVHLSIPALMTAPYCLSGQWKPYCHIGNMSDGTNSPSGREQQAHWAMQVSRNCFFWSRIAVAKVILLAAAWAHFWPQSPEGSSKISQAPASPLQMKTFSSSLHWEIRPRELWILAGLAAS